MADHGRAQGAFVFLLKPCAHSLTRSLPMLEQQQMCLLLREALAVGKIAIACNFFSNELALTEAKMRIRDELSSYCVVTEPPKTTFGKVRPHTHARAVGLIAKRQDSGHGARLHCTG